MMAFIDDKFIERKQQLFFLSASIVISVLSGLAPDLLQTTFTTADQVLLGAIVFTVFVLFDVLIVLAITAKNQVQAHELWKVREKGDALLSNIRACLEKLANQAYGDKERDLFVNHFHNRLAQIEGNVREVADKGELRVQEDHFCSAEQVLGTVTGDLDPVYRFTWELEDDEPLFADLNHRLYFEKSATMLRQRSMKEVRVIFVINDVSALKAVPVAKLMDFFNTNDGFDCRIVKSSDYEQLCKGNGIAPQFNEFGIFGSRLLFLTEDDQPTVGVFTKDRARIEKYTYFFDLIWETISVVKKNPSMATVRVPMAELFSMGEEGSSKKE
jgi:hypothetical protein